MKSVKHLLASLGLAFALALGAAILPAAPAFATDRITLKDGKVLEGAVVRESDGTVWFKFTDASGSEKTELFTPGQFSKLERNVAADPKPADKTSDNSDEKATPKSDDAKPADSKPADATKPADKADDVVKPKKPGVPRAAVLTLGDEENGNMVGVYMTADILRRAIKPLQDEGVDIVVLRFHSGGGALIEIQKLSDVIHNEMKPKFRVVAWIESAISAAAMTAHCIEEIYFTPQGNYGACTGFSGRLVAMKGPGLEQVLLMMEKISARGNKDPKIMRAMQIESDPKVIDDLKISGPSGALSATIDANGDVHWFQDETSGEHVLNPKGGVRILTFNAQEAEQFKFSRGTAATLDELAKAMKLTEVEWVGKKVPGCIWPISRAEQLQMDFRKKTHVDEESLNNYYRLFQEALAHAQAASTPEDRAKFVGIARNYFNKIKKMVENNPNMKLFSLGMDDEQFEDFVRKTEKLLRDLLKN